MGHHLTAIVTILFLLGGTTTTSAVFLSTPTSVNATLGSTATFNCSNNATGGTAFWLVNGSPLTELKQSDITSTTMDGRTRSIHLPATEEYNNTVVVCEVVIRDPLSIETSDPAVLRVQGLLDAVSNLRSESLGEIIHLTWDAPVSLDITGVDLDIWYRVEISVDNISMRTYDNINIPEFNFTMDNDTSTSVVYEFQVTPINDVGYGTISYFVSGYFIGQFVDIPTSVNATLDSTVTFNCSTNAPTGTFEWLVNGLLLAELNTPDITARQVGRTSFLHVPAKEEYNNTSVVCELTVRVPVRSTELSDPAVLRVQGLLDAVSNLKSENLVHAIHLTWEAPPSLDITSVDPDIWYRVDITVNGTSDIILSNYSNVPEFIYRGTNTSVIYMFRVTPINGAGNGATSAPVTGYFIGLPSSITPDMVETIGSATMNVNITIAYMGGIPPGKMPHRFQVHAETIDSGDKLTYCTGDIQVTPNSDGRVFIQLNTSTPTCSSGSHSLASHRRYKATVTAQNIAGGTNSTGDIHFSTHEVQTCTVNYSRTGTVNINCMFAENSKAKGYLSILHSKTNSFRKIYVVASREDTSSSNLDINISGTPVDDYNMVVFDLGRNGLPPVLSGDINYVLAAEEENITVTTPGYTEVDDAASVNGTFLEVPDIINAELILCVSFESSSKVNGTVLLAQRIDDPEKLLVFVPDSTNCAMAPPPGGYSLGVFTQSSENTLEEPATPLTISVHIVPIMSPMPSAVPTATNDALLSLMVVAVTVAVFTLLVTVTVVTAVIIICLKTTAKKDKREIGMKPNPAYETVTRPNPSKSARQIATKPCPAYEGVALALH